MEINRRTLLPAAAYIAQPLATAETCPIHPIRLIIPYSAGSSTSDTVERRLADMGNLLGRRIVAENKPTNRVQT